MRYKRCTVFSAVFMLLLGLSLVPHARADEWNQKTEVNFSGPVEIPGKVLSAGTYWFSLLNDDPDRNIVQVWNSNQTQLLATLLTVPDYRMKPTGKTALMFEERPSNQPEALEAWFYPGDNYGHEFVYPESRAREIAKRTNHPVLSMPDEMSRDISTQAHSAKDSSVSELKSAHVKTTTPTGTELDNAQATTASPKQ
jgi:hypothetical protein